jgi:predicted RNA binding protein YcfA (HicA-like mRNA interferase family)
MKRRDLISHLIKEGCVLHREGARHSVFLNPENGHFATVPRHREIENLLVRKICRQLDIPSPP